MINNNEINSPDLLNDIRTPNLLKRKRLGLSRSITKLTGTPSTPTVTNISNEINTPVNTDNKILDKLVHTNPEINKSTPLIRKHLPLSLRKIKVTKINKLTKKKLNFCASGSQSIPAALENSDASNKETEVSLEDDQLSLTNFFETYSDKSCEEIRLDISRLKEENLRKKSELKQIEDQEIYISKLKKETEVWIDGFNRALDSLANKMGIDHDTILNHLNIPLDILK